MARSCIFLVLILVGLFAINTSISSHLLSISGGHSVRQPSDNSDDGSYYKVLGHGINRESNFDEIKKAYRKKAMLLHPDKGGNTEDFKILTEAYEVHSTFATIQMNNNSSFTTYDHIRFYLTYRKSRFTISLESLD